VPKYQVPPFSLYIVVLIRETQKLELGKAEKCFCL